MLITKTGIRWPKPDLFSANVQRHGHHKDQGNIGYEHDEKVLLIDPPTADEHDHNLGLAAPEPDRKQALSSAADFLGEIAAWIADSSCVSSAGCKAWALALLLRPQCCPGSTAARLAEHLGITRQAISKYVAQIYAFSQGRMRSSAMRNENFRKQRRQIAIAAHRRKGHRLNPRGK